MYPPESLCPRNLFACFSIPLLIWLTTHAAIAAPHDNCQMQISNRIIDYGQVTRAELLGRQISPTVFSLGKQNMTLSVTCRQPTLMTIFFRGATGDSADNYNFGNAGNFTLNLSTAQLDGKRVTLGNVQIPGQQPEHMSEAVAMTPGIGVVPVLDERPLRGSNFSVQVEIDTKISTTASRVADQTVWRSSGSFELIEN